MAHFEASDPLVLANGNHNSINLSGNGTNTIVVFGNDNVINATGGYNRITVAVGTGDTIVMPGASGGFDEIGLINGASTALDFRAALATTDWSGNAADLGNYISVASSGSGITISLSATSHGAATAIASVTNFGSTQWDLTAVLAHAVT